MSEQAGDGPMTQTLILTTRHLGALDEYARTLGQPSASALLGGLLQVLEREALAAARPRTREDELRELAHLALLDGDFEAAARFGLRLDPAPAPNQAELDHQRSPLCAADQTAIALAGA